MNCTIPGNNIKAFGKAIQALSKIGDDLCFSIKSDCLTLQSLNINKTSYGIFNFMDIFFASYDLEVDQEELNCKIPMKAALGIFKTTNYKDKIEMCKIELNSKETNLLIKLQYHQDVTVTRNLHLIETAVIKVAYRKDSSLNQIASNPQLFSQILVNFQLNDDDISIDFMGNKATVRNYANNNVNLRGIRSQIVLNSSEFASYTVQDECNITFSLKPLRAAVQFAEIFNLNVALKFETSGRPVVLIVKNPTFEGVFVVATLNADGETQSTATTSTRNRSQRLNLTIEEQQAIEAIFSDDFDEMDLEVDKQLPNTPLDNTQSKKMKNAFPRCFDVTSIPSSFDFGEVLASDTDSE